MCLPPLEASLSLSPLVPLPSLKYPRETYPWGRGCKHKVTDPNSHGEALLASAESRP